MKRIILIVSLLLLALPSFAQKVGNAGGYYTSSPDILEIGNLRYKDLKWHYNKNDYYTLDNPRFGLALPWVNVLVPGLAQYIMDEPGSGTTYLLLGVGFSTISTVGSVMARLAYLNPRANGAQALYNRGLILATIGSIGSLTAGVLSLFNAYNLVKVKSLYIEDMKNYRRGYTFTMQPTMNLDFTPAGYRPAPGLGLQVSF